MAELLSSVREAIRNLAAFFVLSTILLRLLPGESYARYLRFFLGLLLTVALLRPIAAVLSAEDLLADALDLSVDAFGGDLEESIAAASAGEWTAVLSAYQEEIQEQINEQIADLGVCVTDISVDDREEILTFVISKTDRDADSEAAIVSENTDSEKSGDSSIGAVKIEIPVIYIFVETGEEDGIGSGNRSESENEAGAKVEVSENALSDEEIAAIVKSRIAEYCGISGESLEIVVSWTQGFSETEVHALHELLRHGANGSVMEFASVSS